MEIFLVYLWLKLDSFITASVFVWIVFVILGCISTVVLLESGGKIYEGEKEQWQIEKGPEWRKFKKGCFITAFLFFIFSVAVPSSKETAILVGTAIAVDVAKSPEGTKIAQILRGKANQLLDEQIKSLEK